MLLQNARFDAPASPLMTRVCVFLALVLIAGSWAWHLRDIDVGTLQHFDEFYSYDRTLGFSRMDDWWAVYSLGEPSLKKPPMQYWMSAGLMELGVDHLIAMRLPSMLFALGVLLATMALAVVMLPGQPLVMLTSVAFMTTSTQFWWHATSAMLDAGAALFATLGIVSILLSLQDRRYWPTFPVTVFLAGLQKGPTPLAFLAFALAALAITRRVQPVKVREILRDRRFKRSLLAALFLGFAWQIFQGVRFYGQDALTGYVEREMVARFAPSPIDLVTRGFESFWPLIIVDEPVPRLMGFAGLALLPFATRRPLLYATTGIAAFFVLVMLSAAGSVYSRYTLTILPLLCVGAAGLVFLAVPRFAPAGIAAALALTVALGGPFRTSSEIGLGSRLPYGVDLAELLPLVGSQLREEERLALCRFTRRIPPGAVSVYIPQARDPIEFRTPDIHDALRRRGYEGEPLRGICRPEELEQIAEKFTDLETNPLPGPYLQWTASGVLPEVSAGDGD